MTKKNKTTADISDFKFDLTMKQVLENVQDAVEKIQAKNYPFEEAANDIINVNAYMKHYSMMKDIPADNFTMLFDLDEARTRLEKRFQLIHGEGKLIETQHAGGQKYVDYLKRTQQP